MKDFILEFLKEQTHYLLIEEIAKELDIEFMEVFNTLFRLHYEGKIQRCMVIIDGRKYFKYGIDE